jgi:MFS family permease
MLSSPRDPESPHIDDIDSDVRSQDDEILQDEKDIPLSKRPSIAEALPFGREVLFVSVVVLAQFTAQVGFGQTLAILHVIGHHFKLSSDVELSWLVAGYSLTIGTFILISGRFGDLFGYKLMLIIGFAWFSLWSMVAGLGVYSSHVLFVFARVFQGIGPAITLPNGLALLGATYNPGKRKDMVFAIFGATAPGKFNL